MTPETEPRSPSAISSTPSDPVPITTASTAEVAPVDSAPAQAGPAPAAAPVAGPSWGGLLLSTTLAVVAGGLGAWGYQRYLDQPATKPVAVAEPEPAPTPIERPAPSPEEGRSEPLDVQFRALERRFNRLQEQVAAIPKDQPLPELGALKARVAHLEKSTDATDGVDESIKILQARVAHLDRDMGQVQDQVTALRPLPTAGALSPLARPATRHEAAKPAPAEAEHDAQPLAHGAELFEQGKYAEALRIFEGLQRTYPDDARVWYFSALANGYVSDNWTGTTAQLIDKGIERERAGTPRAATIDATFSKLNLPDKARTWLDYYRRQAHQQARK